MANPMAADLDLVLEQVGPLWEDLRGARLFLTGGTGFFGCWLLESLLWAEAHHGLGVEVVVLTRSPASFARKAPHLAGHRAVRLHEGDVRSFADPDGAFTHVIHAATEATRRLNAEGARVMFDTIVAGTRRTLDFAQRAGASRFLLTSSGAVYGRQPAELTHVGEDYPGAPDPTDPRSAYGEGSALPSTWRRHGVACPRIGSGDCPLFCVCRAVPAARHPLCGWELHPRCPGRRAGPGGRGRNAVSLVPVCGRPDGLALDDPGALGFRAAPTT